MFANMTDDALAAIITRNPDPTTTYRARSELNRRARSVAASRADAARAARLGFSPATLARTART